MKKEFTLTKGAIFSALSAEMKCLTTRISQRLAFTLAEVLITLAIIGVVAALTIPNLIQSYKKQVVETRLAKFYSMMNQVIKLAEIDYGPQNTWTDYHIDHSKSEDGGYSYDKGDEINVRVQKYFAPYVKILNSEDFFDIPEINKNLNQPQRIYYLADGSAFSFGLHENREIFFYPSNPKKCLKNMEYPDGRCRFVFDFLPASNGGWSSCFKYNIGNGMQPDLASWNGQDDLKSLCSNSTNEPGRYCTAVIHRNGWKIPKDYPFRF